MKQFSHTIILFLAFILLAAGCSGQEEDPVVVTGISLNKNSTTIEPQETEQLAVFIFPLNADNRKVTWTSSDASVAAVSSNGLVTGISAGYATVTATTADGGWDVGSVTNMYWLFAGADVFNQNLSGWNVSNVTVYDDAFTGCPIAESNKPAFQ